jgi:hypothetical protein
MDGNRKLAVGTGAKLAAAAGKDGVDGSGTETRNAPAIGSLER